MLDSDRIIYQYNRESWTLKDLRDVVAAHIHDDPDSQVLLATPMRGPVPRGTIEVVGQR